MIIHTAGGALYIQGTLSVIDESHANKSSHSMHFQWHSTLLNLAILYHVYEPKHPYDHTIVFKDLVYIVGDVLQTALSLIN